MTSSKCDCSADSCSCLALHVGIVLDAEAQYAAAADALEEIGRERVIDIDHRDAVVGQRLVDGALGFGDAQQDAHALDVRRRDIVHQGHLRRDDAGQIGDVAQLAGAHFIYGEFGVFRRVDDRQRQADFIIAVAGIDVGLAGAVENAVQQWS